jgi:hypothetical protein
MVRFCVDHGYMGDSSTACRKSYHALYRRAPCLFDELGLARADGRYTPVLAHMARVDVLIIDDFANAPITVIPVAPRDMGDTQP